MADSQALQPPVISQSEFKIGNLRVAALLEARPYAADRLTVVLNGYCARATRTPPVFVEWPQSSHTYGHILRISDPTLFLVDWLNGSCFIGTEADDPVPAVIECSKKVARELGVADNRIVYFGHSGAGFGALQCAINHQAASGLAINSMIEMEQFAKYQFAKEMVSVFRPDAELNEIFKEYPKRLSVIAALRNAHEQGIQPCLGIMQNVLDKHHYTKHFINLCKAFDISVIGGKDATGLIHAQTFIRRFGHNGLPEEDMMESLIQKLHFLRSRSPPPTEQP